MSEYSSAIAPNYQNPLASAADIASGYNKLDLQQSLNAMQIAHARDYMAQAQEREFQAQQAKKANDIAASLDPKTTLPVLAQVYRSAGLLDPALKIEKLHGEQTAHLAQADHWKSEAGKAQQAMAISAGNAMVSAISAAPSYADAYAGLKNLDPSVVTPQQVSVLTAQLQKHEADGWDWQKTQSVQQQGSIPILKKMEMDQAAQIAANTLAETKARDAEIARHNPVMEKAAMTNANAHAASAAAARSAASSSLSAPTEVTDETGNSILVQRDKTGKLIPVVGYGPKDPAAKIGAREAVFADRIIRGANQSAKDLENIISLPIEASTGVFGGRQQGPGLLAATKEVLANKMTQQDAQSYNVMATGFQRNLAAIESAGLMPSGSLTKQMESILWKEGDTNLTKLQKLAQIAQIVEAGMETTAANPRLPQETKDHAADIVKTIRKSVPFTQQDLIKLQSQQQINPNTTLADVLKLKNAPAEVYSDAEKERRYQEWKAKQK